jgi:hypothetical protein
MKYLKMFEKFFSDDNIEFDYEDEYVWGRVSIGDGILKILDWNTKNTSKGGTLISIENLRRQYQPHEIHAIDCGYPHEDSFGYWTHLKNKGVIDGFRDDGGVWY